MKYSSLFGATTLLVAGLLTHSPSAHAATTNVSYGFFFFSPPVVTIHPGDTVEWNSVSSPHTLAGTDGKTGPDDVICGSNSLPCSHTFTTPGVYPYECTLHWSFGMTGTVIVASVALPLPKSPVMTNAAVLTNGQFQFTVLTGTNQTDVVQASGDLSSGQWISLATNPPTGDGRFAFQDTNSPPAAIRFYRVKTLNSP